MLKKSFLAVLILMVLTACSNKEEKMSDEERQKIIDDGTVGYEMVDGNFKKADNISTADEQAILAAFDEYIAALNAEEIERYMNTVAKNPKGFDYEEERIHAAETFEQSDTKREVENVTITQYKPGQEAQVVAHIKTKYLQLETNVEHEGAGRQVTVFVKEDGDWKVTSVFYIGDDSQSSTGNH